LSAKVVSVKETLAATDLKAAARNANISLGLLLAGGAAGIYNMTSHVIPFGSGFEMVALAQNLVRHGSFGNPFAVLNTGPTAANPPLYPFLLALIIKVFRVPEIVVFIATLGNIIANAVSANLIWRISGLFFKDLRVGVVAAIFWILSSQLTPSWDVGYTVATLLIFCLLTARTISRPRFLISGIGAGLLAGALFLFNPSTILISMPWLGWLAYKHRASLKHALFYCCLVCGVLCVAGATWGVRNQEQLGKFVIRTNLGMTLYASDNDCARPSLIASEANNCYQAHHPNTSIEEAQLLKNLGEVNYDQVRRHDAEEWMRTHPIPLLRLTLARVRDFWFPIADKHVFQSAVIWICTVLSIPGLILMVRKRNDVTAFVGFVLLIYPLMYYVVVSDVRYRLPVLWLSLLSASTFVIWCWDLRSGSPRTVKTSI
jgi:predicted lipoprotein with Yx(FWY)xxD motif